MTTDEQHTQGKFSCARLLTLSSETMNPSKHFDSLTSLSLQLVDFNLQTSRHSLKSKTNWA